MNYAAVFPPCRAVVHHGGSGTTAASLRAGIPTLVLWSSADQPYWGAQVKRLQVGTARRFSATTGESLVADLRRILAPQIHGPRPRTRCRDDQTGRKHLPHRRSFWKRLSDAKRLASPAAFSRSRRLSQLAKFRLY